jgi:Leucine-rich repeat (LRR) protein
MFKTLAKNGTLSSLKIDYCDMDQGGIEVLAGMPSLTQLSVEGNKLSDASAKALARCPSLRALNIAKNGIGDEGAKALAESRSLTSLKIDGNKIGKCGIEVLSANPNLTYLEITNNPGNDEASNTLGKMINQKVKQRKSYFPETGRLLSLAFNSSRELPLDLEKLILEYCESPLFTLRYTVDDYPYRKVRLEPKILF